MFHRASLFLTFLWALLLLSACDQFSADAQAVRDCWESYDKACESRDGKTALSLLSAASIARYENLKKLALDAEANQIKVLSSWDQLEIFTMRTGLKRSELMKLDAPAYCVHAVDHGWWATGEEAGPLGSLKIRKDVATATDRDELGKWSIEFVRENGQWKLDEPATDRFFEARIARVAAEEGKSSTDVLVFIVEEAVGPVDEQKLWKPMR